MFQLQQAMSAIISSLLITFRRSRKLRCKISEGCQQTLELILQFRMVVWRGKGWIVIILALLAIGIPLELKGVYIGLGQLLLFCIFAWPIWWIGNKLNAGQNYHSEAAGKFVWKDIFEVGLEEDHEPSVLGPELSPSHSFTLIKMQYWSPLFVLAGISCFVAGLLS